jgi:hypothetical protein
MPVLLGMRMKVPEEGEGEERGGAEGRGKREEGRGKREEGMREGQQRGISSGGRRKDKGGTEKEEGEEARLAPKKAAILVDKRAKEKG